MNFLGSGGKLGTAGFPETKNFRALAVAVHVVVVVGLA